MFPMPSEASFLPCHSPDAELTYVSTTLCRLYDAVGSTVKLTLFIPDLKNDLGIFCDKEPIDGIP